jgi:hypothetical protein
MASEGKQLFGKLTLFLLITTVFVQYQQMACSGKKLFGRTDIIFTDTECEYMISGKLNSIPHTVRLCGPTIL